MSQPSPSLPGATEAVEPTLVSPKRSGFSWIWLLPIVAAIVGASLVLRNLMLTGPNIEIYFDSAESLVVGQTKLRYRDVEVGHISSISVAPDRKGVVVKARLELEGADYITQEQARFWVVRPRLGLSGVSGLGTLLSGAYIAVDAPQTVSKADKVYEFHGLESPPEIISGRPGSRYVLTTPSLGSLDRGSPVYYQGIQVGQVIGYEFNPEGEGVHVQVFVDAPYDQYITDSTRFWNVSGVNMSVDAGGFTVRTHSLVAALAGGVAFERSTMGANHPVPPNTYFELFRSQTEALAEPDGVAVPLQFHFYQSTRGLQAGAAVEFRGLELGNVTDVQLEYDSDKQSFYALVKARIYPQRLGSVYNHVALAARKGDDPLASLIAPMVKHGLRAQMRPANLLTGKQYVALEFFPKAPEFAFNERMVPLLVPTIAGDFDRLQEQVSNIVNKVSAIPFPEIGAQLEQMLKQMNLVVRKLDQASVPQLNQTLLSVQKAVDQVASLLASDSSLNSNLEQNMRELNRAMRSMRDLADSLQAQPSSLLRGRKADVLLEP